LPEHAAPSAIAPAGSDLRVVARVRMVTPGRGMASMRVAMRVTVTEQDEDERSLARAIKQAVRTLALVALLVAALAAGARRTWARDGAHTALVAVGGVGGVGVDDVHAIELAARLLAALAAAPSSPVRARSERMPRPALVAGVVPSPD
jgi:hypothetical protein